MARNRMVKPEFWSDEDLHQLSLGARLLFVGMWNFADDFGVLLDSDRQLLGEIFPLDEDISERKIRSWKNELIERLMLIPVCRHNANYLIVRTWRKHQKVEHPSSRRWLSDEEIESLTREYLDSHENLGKVSRSKEERGKKKEKEKEESTANDISPEKKHPFKTENVLISEEEYQKLRSKLGSQDAVKWCCEKLDNYLGESEKNKKKYTSHYKAILNWVIDEWEEHCRKNKIVRVESPGSYRRPTGKEEIRSLSEILEPLVTKQPVVEGKQ